MQASKNKFNMERMLVKPSIKDKNLETKSLAIWFNTQQHNFAHKLEIMKNPNIYIKWENFKNKYPKIF